MCVRERESERERRGKRKLPPPFLTSLRVLLCAGQRVLLCSSFNEDQLVRWKADSVGLWETEATRRTKKSWKGRDGIKTAIFVLNPLLEPLKIKKGWLKETVQPYEDKMTRHIHFLHMHTCIKAQLKVLVCRVNFFHKTTQQLVLNIYYHFKGMLRLHKCIDFNWRNAHLLREADMFHLTQLVKWWPPRSGLNNTARVLFKLFFFLTSQKYQSKYR